MGFFKAIGRGFGKIVEKVGDFVGSETISSAGRSIQDACTERIASERSYDKKEANIYTTERLNEILISFSEGYLQQATSIENNCIRLVEQYYDKLIQLIKSTPGSTQNAANLKALKKGKKRISETITGGIKDPLAKRMSLDDSECLKILKMDSGENKRQAMTKFSKKVINEALNNLAQSVRKALNNQVEDIQDYLSSISEEQEKTMQVLRGRFDKMVKDNEFEKSDKEKNCVLPLYIIDASDYVFDILK